jgi:hypothetical protein
LTAEVASQHELHSAELASRQIGDKVSHDVAGGNRTDLIDQQPPRSTGNLKLGSVDGRAGGPRRWNHARPRGRIRCCVEPIDYCASVDTLNCAADGTRDYRPARIGPLICSPPNWGTRR